MAICIIKPLNMKVGSDEVLLTGNGHVHRIHKAFTTT